MSCNPIKLTQTTNKHRHARWIIETRYTHRIPSPFHPHTHTHVVHILILSHCTESETDGWRAHRSGHTNESEKFQLKNILDGLEWLCADTQKKAIRQEEKKSFLAFISFTSFDQLYILSIKFAFLRSFVQSHSFMCVFGCRSFYLYLCTAFELYISASVCMPFPFGN